MRLHIRLSLPRGLGGGGVFTSLVTEALDQSSGNITSRNLIRDVSAHISRVPCTKNPKIRQIRQFYVGNFQHPENIVIYRLNVNKVTAQSNKLKAICTWPVEKQPVGLFMHSIKLEMLKVINIKLSDLSGLWIYNMKFINHSSGYTRGTDFIEKCSFIFPTVLNPILFICLLFNQDSL
jgi:hypothetical protein